MEFTHGKTLSGDYVTGVVEEWAWHRRGGSYAEHRDFFVVHWELQLRYPNDVRLHVESPRAEVDEQLNAIKADVVDALLSAAVEAEVERRGFAYVRGRKISEACVRRYKSTEPFRVVVDGAALGGPERSLALVHDALRDLVHARLAPHVPALDRWVVA